MTNYSLLLTFLLSFSLCNCLAQQKTTQINIIPKPNNLEVLGDGYFQISSTTNLVFEGKCDFNKVIKVLNSTLLKSCDYSLNTSKERKSNFILLKKIDDSNFPKEAYNLVVNKNSIEIESVSEAGLFYGLQTLLQLLPVEVFSQTKISGLSLKVPFVKISDNPRFTYRGMHLDVCRHFMPLEFVKKYIDMIAFHKMNKFHWHLTEDQGWRIEIKKYPKLQEISAFRDGTLIGHFGDKPHKFDNIRHGGFYTQEEIKEVIKYAEDRFVEVIPEIEMPGHSVAALAAYPNLSCTDGKFEVEKRWGVFDDVFCAGKEETFQFLEDVLTEVIALFPSQYVHIGGDECPKTRWKTCPHCQARIQKEGLKDEHELQSYFVKRIEKFVNSKGKRLIGWDEILEGGLAPDATVMSWRGYDGGIQAANEGHDVIMTPYSDVYFDYYQGDPKTEPLAIGGYLPLEKVYSFEPIPDKINEENKKHILGAQANVWTEYIKTSNHVEYMVFPRISALAEVVWTKPELKNYQNFLERIELQFKRYDKLGINYSKSHYTAKLKK